LTHFPSAQITEVWNGVLSEHTFCSFAHELPRAFARSFGHPSLPQATAKSELMSAGTARRRKNLVFIGPRLPRSYLRVFPGNHPETIRKPVMAAVT
jgi:hypothetical protein